jgi:hypothetical protein
MPNGELVYSSLCFGRSVGVSTLAIAFKAQYGHKQCLNKGEEYIP